MCVYITPKDGATPIYAAALQGQTDAVKELIAAGCDINLATKVKQMTRLALALALSAFRARLPLAPLATLNLQYLFRLFVLLFCISKISLENTKLDYERLSRA